MEPITNDKLVEFLQSRIERIQNDTCTLEEFIPLVALYIEECAPESHLAFDEQKIRQHALLGWYLTTPLDKSTR